MSKTHEHDWVTNMFVFPETDGDYASNYEYDEPYEVLYCTDRECGQRTTRLISEDLALEVRQFNAFPNEEVKSGGGE